MMNKVILFNIRDLKRIELYEYFFKTAGFELLGFVFSGENNFSYKNYAVYKPEDLKNTKFDLVMAHPDEISILKNLFNSEGLPLSKTRILYYDFNNVQKILGSENIKHIFYDNYEIVDNKVSHKLKHKNILGKYTKVSTKISEDFRKNIIDEVYDSYKKQIKDAETVESVYKPGRNWGNFMKKTRPEFYNAVMNQDKKIIYRLLPLFFRNCMSTGMFGGEEVFNGFVNTKDPYGAYFDCFKVWLAKTEITEPDFEELGLSPEGGIYGINIDSHIVNINSFMFHSRATLCKKLLNKYSKSVVAEIGGGTALLGYYLTKMNTGITYIDFDLPDNLISASYYLKASFPDKKILLYDKKENLPRKKLLEYDIVLMPNFMIPYLENNSVDMFVNTISFGEMNYETVCEYYNQIERCGSRYFYHENIFAPHGGYECYPVPTYPKLNTFRPIYSTPSSWPGIFDATNKNYMYVEQLYEKENL